MGYDGSLHVAALPDIPNSHGRGVAHAKSLSRNHIRRQQMMSYVYRSIHQPHLPPLNEIRKDSESRLLLRQQASLHLLMMTAIF